MKIEATCRVKIESDDPAEFGGPPERIPDEELRHIVHYWQDRLRLLDWDIHISYLPFYEMGNEDRQGEAEYCRETHTAKIRLVDPSSADPSRWPWHPTETTIIHELLHLLIEPIWKSEDKRFKVDVEHIINVLSQALYEQRLLGEEADKFVADISKGFKEVSGHPNNWTYAKGMGINGG